MGGPTLLSWHVTIHVCYLPFRKLGVKNLTKFHITFGKCSNALVQLFPATRIRRPAGVERGLVKCKVWITTAPTANPSFPWNTTRSRFVPY
jgi:hypothetical protein